MKKMPMDDIKALSDFLDYNEKNEKWGYPRNTNDKTSWKHDCQHWEKYKHYSDIVEKWTETKPYSDITGDWTTTPNTKKEPSPKEKYIEKEYTKTKEEMIKTKKTIKPKEKSEWEKDGFNITEERGWKAAGFTIPEAIEWKEAGFKPEEAVVWKAVGFSLEKAKKWRDNGFSTLEANILEKLDIPLDVAKGKIAPGECIMLQVFGFVACDDCSSEEAKNCKGEKIIESGENSLGIEVPVL